MAAEFRRNCPRKRVVSSFWADARQFASNNIVETSQIRHPTMTARTKLERLSESLMLPNDLTCPKIIGTTTPAVDSKSGSCETQAIATEHADYTSCFIL
jgi:hypothetical protein